MRKYLLPIIIIVVLTLGLWVAYLLTQKNQQLKNRAAIVGGVGSVSITPSTVTKYPGDSFSSVIKFKTGGYAISSLSLRLTYNYTGTTPELQVVDASGNASSTVYPDSGLTSTGDWSFPIKTVTIANGKVTIDIAAINTNIAGFTTNTDVNLATVYFKVNRAVTTNPLTLSFDTTNSKMITKGNGPSSSGPTGPVDVLALPVNYFYTITADTTAPAAISNLSVGNVTTNSLILSWTAPSDVGPTGKASGYDLRFSTTPISVASFGSLSIPPQLTISTPGNAGTGQTASVGGLTPNTTYYFAIKSNDSAGNISGISNVISTTTFNPCTQNPTSVALSPSSQTGRSDQTLTYTATIQNNDSAGCGSTAYTLAVNAPSSSWTTQLSQTSLTIAPASNGTVTLNITPNSVTSGSYNFSINVSKAGQQVNSATGIYIVNNVKISYKFKLQGVTGAGVVANQPSIDFKYLANNQMQGFAGSTISDSSGIFGENNLDRGAMLSGAYDASVKVNGFLRKALRNVQVNYGANTLDWSATPLKAGDFDNNNMLDVSDLGLMLSKYVSLSNAVNAQSKIYDVNGDGVIDIVDIGIVLSNYTALQVPGDNY